MPTRRHVLGALAAIGITSSYAGLNQAHARIRRHWSRRYGKSASSGSDDSRFPDPIAWVKVRPGMSEEDVLKLLGEPIKKESPRENTEENQIWLYRWCYGHLPIDVAHVPAHFEFELLLHRGKVCLTVQPFEVNDPTVLLGPRPSLPRMIYPQEGQTFVHYPRIVDFRWQPSVGDYPISYEVEIQAVESADDSSAPMDVEWRQPLSTRVDIPYLSTELPGTTRYRWRVKARNRYGESEWTGFATFTFRDG